MQPKVLKLVFPPGAGGNWLIHTINNMPVIDGTANFHYRTWTPSSILIKPVHMFPPDHFLFLNGNLTLNFFLNGIQKYWLAENYPGYGTTRFLNSLLNIWAVIVTVSQQAHPPDFDWQNLLHDPASSHTQLIKLQHQFGQEEMSRAEFIQRRLALFNTLVSVREVQNNWQHPMWTVAVLADARLNGLLPNEWQFRADISWQHYRDLAQQFAGRVNIQWHDFGSNVAAPDLKHLTSQLA
jgi:hypothetical protein